MKINKLKELKYHKIAILWYWKEGKSTLIFLLKLWFKNITILDKNTNIEKKDDINYQLWKTYLDNLCVFDLIFKSPWISPYNTEILPFKDKLTSQANIFFDNYNWKVIWITGTKGKSTTVTLTYKVLKEIWNNVKLVWNIWTPVLDEIDILNNKSYDYIIYELSSYMLEMLKPKLYIWVLNNIYNCHLDWHDWKENYTNAKYNILKYSQYKLANFELINNKEIKLLENIKFFWEKWNYYYKKPLFYINEQHVFEDKNIALQWEHNRKNISAVIWILNIIDNKNTLHNVKVLQKILSVFNWLPHRIEDIWTYNWITFIDDAIATTPESTIAAIKTFWEKIWTIFLWGQDSGFNFEILRKILEKYNIQNIVLFPDTWEKIFWDLSNYNYETSFILKWKYSPKIFKTKFMKSAIDFAYKNTSKWKICILSNAAPSFSLWTWYIQKGLEFQEEVKKSKTK